MIVILSPAKTLDFTRRISSNAHSEALFSAEADSLVQMMRSYSLTDLLQVMSMSEKLAMLTYERFKNWDDGDVEQKQAGAAFKGEAYNGLDLISLDEEALDFAQDHLRILSGLYGALRPYDLIKPYRLEMGSKLKKDSLYLFWKEKITSAINQDIERYGSPLINLASNEYFKVLDKKVLKTEVITPIFKEKKDGKLKTVVVYAKKARGMMARYIIENQLSDWNDLKSFDMAGYTYNERASAGNELVFTR